MPRQIPRRGLFPRRLHPRLRGCDLRRGGGVGPSITLGAVDLQHDLTIKRGGKGSEEAGNALTCTTITPLDHNAPP